MANLTLEDIKIRLRLSSANNIYFSYNYPEKEIFITNDSYHETEIRKYNLNLVVESDYDCVTLNLANFKLQYKTFDSFHAYRANYKFKLHDESYSTEMRSSLRVNIRPIIDSLIAMGFVNETDIEDFMLLKKNRLHLIRISQEEKDAELRKKAEEERSLRLKEYILITDDSGSIESSNIQRFQSLSRSSDIVMTLGTEEFKGTNETIGYIEFIPTIFNDSIRVAFLLCESDKFAEKRVLINTINRILRFMLPIYEILRKDFAIDTEIALSIARGEITGPIIISRITPIDNTAGISKEILQLSDLADELSIEPVDMVVVSCKDNIWNLSFSDGRLLRIDSQGQKEHSLNVIKHELLNHGYFIHEPAFDNYMKKADFTKNLYFKRNRNN